MVMTKNQEQFPTMYIEGISGYVVDVTSQGKLQTDSNVGTSTLSMGPRTLLTGPSGYIANVDSNGNLSTTNG